MQLFTQGEILGIVGAAVAAVGLLIYFSRKAWMLRRRRRAIVVVLRNLAARLPLTEATVKSYPAPTLGGHLNGYPTNVSCTKADAGWLWRIQTELETEWAGHLVMHGEDRPSKMRELYGMEIVLTGDRAFDRRVVVASTDERLALRLLGTYLRERFRKLGHAHFQIDVRDQAVIAEMQSHNGLRRSQLPAYLYLVNTLTGMLDLLLQRDH